MTTVTQAQVNEIFDLVNENPPMGTLAIQFTPSELPRVTSVIPVGPWIINNRALKILGLDDRKNIQNLTVTNAAVTIECVDFVGHEKVNSTEVFEIESPEHLSEAITN